MEEPLDFEHRVPTGKLRFVERQVEEATNHPNVAKSSTRRILQQEWRWFADDGLEWEDVPLEDEV